MVRSEIVWAFGGSVRSWGPQQCSEGTSTRPNFEPLSGNQSFTKQRSTADFLLLLCHLQMTNELFGRNPGMQGTFLGPSDSYGPAGQRLTARSWVQTGPEGNRMRSQLMSAPPKPLKILTEALSIQHTRSELQFASLGSMRQHRLLKVNCHSNSFTIFKSLVGQYSVQINLISLH